LKISRGWLPGFSCERLWMTGEPGSDVRLGR